MRFRMALALLFSCLPLVAAPVRDELKFTVISTRAIVALPLQVLAAERGRVVAEYPAMHVIGVPSAAADRVADRLVRLGFEVTPLDELIRTPGRTIDPHRDAPAAAAHTAGLYVLQYEAPPTAAWQALVRDAGVVAVAPLPHQTTIICATAEQVAALNRLPWVRYLAPYLPEDKYSPSREGDAGLYTLQMATAEIAAQAIEHIRTQVGGFRAESVYGGQLTAIIETDLTTARALVHDPFVLGVAPYALPEPSDERQALSVTGVATPSGDYLAWLAARGITPEELTRSEAVVDIADTGVDYGCLVNREGAHADFRDRIVYVGGTTGGTLSVPYSDNYAHGSVVAGVAAGNPAAGVGSTYLPTTGTNLREAGTNFYYGLGIAPGARIGNTKILPGPVGTVAQWTTRAVNQNCNDPRAPCTNASPLRSCVATVQNHSNNQYTDDGADSGRYTPNAQLFDISVRDADHRGALTRPLAVTVSTSRRSVRTNTSGMGTPWARAAIRR
jgi:hypothetical protein